jgi:imidazoleglycerol phosphate synthase glutamine amidotransferase subunit HisH
MYSSHIYWLHGFIPNPCKNFYFIGSYGIDMDVIHLLVLFEHKYMSRFRMIIITTSCPMKFVMDTFHPSKSLDYSMI